MTASATLASASAINSDNALCALKIHRKVSNGVVQSAPLGRQSDADTRSELRISHAAAQARTVYGVGIRLAAFLYPRDPQARERSMVSSAPDLGFGGRVGGLS
jgi:hypothetical protein